MASDFETFGVVLIEALAMGRPVIATDCGGPREIVNESNGMLVPARDNGALARAMQRMVEQRHRYEPMSHQAVYESVIG
jgi:glycosyltransferase involved in cell wall biosynthesis